MRMAAEHGKAELLNFEEVNVYDQLMEMTGGRGPDRCIDAVGGEAHAGGTFDGTLDAIKTSIFLATDRPHVLRQAIWSCRKGGTVSIPGVYVGFGDKIPIGAAMNKGLTIKQGQTHMLRYMEPLLEKVQNGEIDPSFIITHRLPLEDAPRGYEMFKHKEDNCIKVVLKPGA
jgi:threonine dehydrogenase-like Zn-dependent dehydrogenase